MKRIAIVTNFNIYEKASAALSVADKLHSLGCEVLVASFNREKISRQRLGRRDFISFIPLEKIYQTAELIIVLGGDGTILESARKAAPAGIPLLGINLGRLGYMAELELDETDRLSEIVEGKYRLDRRMMIKVEVIGRDGNVKFESYALNDAVISNGVTARMIDLALSEGGAAITNYRADGLIIATPTGSTAYSMSAGGAIADPRINCLCVTPICSHSLTARPLVFPDSAVLEIKNTSQREKMLYVTVDGRINYELYRGNIVRITRSPMETTLIRLKKYSFYRKLRAKMNRE